MESNTVFPPHIPKITVPKNNFDDNDEDSLFTFLDKQMQPSLTSKLKKKIEKDIKTNKDNDDAISMMQLAPPFTSKEEKQGEQKVAKASFPGSDESDDDTSGVVFMKSKYYTRRLVKNKKTGRLNQVSCCNLCNKIFPKKCNLEDHLRTHFGQKPFTCKYCNQAYSQRGNRDRHQENAICQRFTPRIKEEVVAAGGPTTQPKTLKQVLKEIQRARKINNPQNNQQSI